VPYQSGTVDKFERLLAAMSPLVVRHAASTRLLPDAAGRFAHQEITTAYELMVAPDCATLAEAIDLTLKSFKLESVTVLMDGYAELFTDAEVLSMMDGLHPWSEG